VKKCDAVVVVNNKFDFDRLDPISKWQTAQELSIHAISLSKHCQEWNIESRQVAEMFTTLGIYFENVLGDGQKAIAFFEKALAIRVQSFGDSHLHVASCYNNLGVAQLVLQIMTKQLSIMKKHLQFGYTTLVTATLMLQAATTTLVVYITLLKIMTKQLSIMKQHLQFEYKALETATFMLQAATTTLVLHNVVLQIMTTLLSIMKKHLQFGYTALVTATPMLQAATTTLVVHIPVGKL